MRALRNRGRWRSAVPPTRASARPSSACSISRCRPPPKSSISSWQRCCAISSWSSRPPSMRLSASELSRFGEDLGRQLHAPAVRSEEHTSELQSHHDLVCRRLLEKKTHTYNEPA